MGMKLPRAAKLPGTPRSKYGAVKTVVDGLTFHSRKEARRWTVLRAESAAGAISGLRRQVTYWLKVDGKKIGRIVLDFVYVRDGRMVFEDVKSLGTVTPMFKWKAKHFKAQYGHDVRVEL